MTQNFLQDVPFNLVSIEDLIVESDRNIIFIPHPRFDHYRTYHLVTKKSYAFGCYTISNTVLLSAYALPLSKNELIAELNYGTEFDGKTLTVPSPLIEEIPELDQAISLVASCSYNFYHWMLDSLPKIVLAEACGFEGTYVIPQLNMNSNFLESLDLMGIDRKRIFPMHFMAVRCKELWLPTHFQGSFIYNTPELLSEYRERMLRHIPSLPRLHKDRIIINRQESPNGRRINNWDDVCEVLTKYEFEPVVMEKYSLAEQISIASQTSAIFGVHGAGFTHIAWMPKGSFVFELYSRSYFWNCYEEISRGTHTYSSHEFPEDEHHCMTVDCHALEGWLKESALFVKLSGNYS